MDFMFSLLQVEKILMRYNRLLSEKFRILMNFITPKNIIASGFVGGLLIVAMSISNAIIYLAKEHPSLFVLFLGALFLACSKNLRDMFWRFICSLFTLIRRKNLTT